MISGAAILFALFAGVQAPECHCPTSMLIDIERQPDGAVVYTYTVKNLSEMSIGIVYIGRSVKEDDAELAENPVGCKEDREKECSCPIAAPAGWNGCVMWQEESNFHFLDFIATDESSRIAPGADARFRVTVPRADATHESPGYRTIAECGCSFVGTATMRPRQ